MTDWPDWFNLENATPEERARIRSEYVENRSGGDSSSTSEQPEKNDCLEDSADYGGGEPPKHREEEGVTTPIPEESSGCLCGEHDQEEVMKAGRVRTRCNKHGTLCPCSKCSGQSVEEFDSEHKTIRQDGKLPAVAEVVDKDGMKFPEPRIEHYNDLEIGDELVRCRSGKELAARRWEAAHEWMQKFDSDERDYWYWKGIKEAALTVFKDFSGIQDNEEALDKLLEINASIEKKNDEVEP